MKSMLEYGTKYIHSMEWKEFALVKICLIAWGTIIGTSIPKRSRKTVAWIATIIFIVTYIPIVIRFFTLVNENHTKKD